MARFVILMISNVSYSEICVFSADRCGEADIIASPQSSPEVKQRQALFNTVSRPAYLSPTPNLVDPTYHKWAEAGLMSGLFIYVHLMPADPCCKETGP
jgi:hypothetical protein